MHLRTSIVVAGATLAIVVPAASAREIDRGATHRVKHLTTKPKASSITRVVEPMIRISPVAGIASGNG
jgi:hypothetical protein